MTTEFKIGRDEVLSAMVAALEPLEDVHAMWEGGAAGFDRVDQWSDLDLQMLVADNRVEDIFERVDDVLRSLSEIELKYRLTEPTWHGHSQCFYRLKDASPFLMIDLAVMKENNEADRFMESRIHGVHRVIFDKKGLVKDKPVDVDEHLNKVKGRLDTLKTTFDLFWILTPKEIHRGNSIEAISFYMNFTLRPLVEVLRIKHCPLRFFYFTRYVHYDLPREVVDRLESLYFPKDIETLETYRQKAEDWFWEVFDEIDLEEVRRKLGEEI
ncbi:MAG: hypothetical protein PVF83_12290 [Anaerolineales bacterium]